MKEKAFANNNSNAAQCYHIYTIIVQAVFFNLYKFRVSSYREAEKIYGKGNVGTCESKERVKFMLSNSTGLNSLLREATPSSMAAFRFKYNTQQLR